MDQARADAIAAAVFTPPEDRGFAPDDLDLLAATLGIGVAGALWLDGQCADEDGD
ncbi:MAG: hypothetical protein R3E84_02140 [Pseudomonadales bacterium]|nr:hypothetical protein [Pseudomonadales bacterium]